MNENGKERRVRPRWGGWALMLFNGDQNEETRSKTHEAHKNQGYLTLMKCVKEPG